MFEQAFRNIDYILHGEMGGTTDAGYPEPRPGLSFKDYFYGLPPDKASEARPLLEQLEQVADQSGLARARYLFAAFVSELFSRAISSSLLRSRSGPSSLNSPRSAKTSGEGTRDINSRCRGKLGR